MAKPVRPPVGVILIWWNSTRLDTCKVAGITPAYRVLESDPTAYILSANVHRRHLNKGQQAMITAMAYPSANRGGDRKSSSFNKLDSEFSKASLSQARHVLRNNFTPEGQKYPDRCLEVMLWALDQ